MSRLHDSEFDGFYTRDRRTNEQIADELGDAMESKLNSPEWVSNAAAIVDFEPEGFKFLIDRDYIAFGEWLLAKIEKHARDEANREVA